MNRCRETAGILFKKKCDQPATCSCVQCKKPICHIHARAYWQSAACVSCLRQLVLQQPHMKQSYAHLRDDPYFYWYYVGDGYYDEPYGADDYALFDDPGGSDLGGGDHGGWEGT